MNIMLSSDIENYKNAVIVSGGKVGNENCGGLILCGGGDIDPVFYNEENTFSKNIDANRDRCEFELIKKFIKEEKPILGICRGMQIINVFFGGTLHQHICDHKNSNGTDTYHAVSIKKSFLSDLYGKEATVNSCHHQAISRLGQGLFVTAYSDKVIEGICHKTLPIIGVQWHPERLEAGKILFDYFLWLCKAYKK